MTEHPRLQSYLQGLRRRKITIKPTKKTTKWEINAEEAFRNRKTGTEWHFGVQNYRNAAHQMLIQVTDAQMIMRPGVRYLYGLDLYLLIVGGTVSVSEMQLTNRGIVHLRVEKGSPVKGLVDLGQGDNEPFAMIRQRDKFHPFHLLIPR